MSHQDRAVRIEYLDEMCLFILDACEKMARCTCEPVVAGKDLRGVCTRIDLVFSYSIDATNCLFTESDALRSRFFLPDPLPPATRTTSRRAPARPAPR